MTERDWQKDWELLHHPERYPDEADFCLCDEAFDCEAQRAWEYWLQRVRELERREKALFEILQHAEIYLYDVGPIAVAGPVTVGDLQRMVDEALKHLRREEDAVNDT